MNDNRLASVSFAKLIGTFAYGGPGGRLRSVLDKRGKVRYYRIDPKSREEVAGKEKLQFWLLQSVRWKSFDLTV